MPVESTTGLRKTIPRLVSKNCDFRLERRFTLVKFYAIGPADVFLVPIYGRSCLSCCRTGRNWSNEDIFLAASNRRYSPKQRMGTEERGRSCKAVFACNFRRLQCFGETEFQEGHERSKQQPLCSSAESYKLVEFCWTGTRKKEGNGMNLLQGVSDLPDLVKNDPCFPPSPTALPL
jgi:hypothetical protein